MGLILTLVSLLEGLRANDNPTNDNWNTYMLPPSLHFLDSSTQMFKTP